MEQSKISGLLGICRKAGRTVIGTELTIEAIRSGKKSPYLVLIAQDASENTVKRITDCCRYYELDTERLSMTGAELGPLLGKSGEVAVVGVCDEGFAKAILNQKKG